MIGSIIYLKEESLIFYKLEKSKILKPNWYFIIIVQNRLLKIQKIIYSILYKIYNLYIKWKEICVMGENTKKWYKSNWFTLLCLVFVFPIGLFLMWKFTNWKTWLKVVVSVFFAIIVIANMGNNQESNQKK